MHSTSRIVNVLLCAAVGIAGCDDNHRSGNTAARAKDAKVGTMAFAALATVDGADAGATPNGAAVSGSATFRATRDGVDAILSFTGCVFKEFYAARLYDAPDCATALAQVGEGNYAARDGIAALTCTGTTGFARDYYSRPNGDPKRWTIADAPSPENVVGKIMILETRDAPVRALACGRVGRVADAPPAGPLPSVAVAGELAGFCVWNALVAVKTAECPNVSTFVDCVDTHCDISRCLDACADHVACIEKLDDACDADKAAACSKSDACVACQDEVQACSVGFCLPTIGCAPPTPNGPCTKLEQCCGKQGDFAEGCLDAIRALERLGGDVSCMSAMHDWDFNFHLQVPCDWDGGMP